MGQLKKKVNEPKVQRSFGLLNNGGCGLNTSADFFSYFSVQFIGDYGQK
jgi:hypothetical protein